MASHLQGYKSTAQPHLANLDEDRKALSMQSDSAGCKAIPAVTRLKGSKLAVPQTTS